MRIDEIPISRRGWTGFALAIGTVLLGMGLSGVAEAQKDKIRLAAQVWYPSFPQYVAQEMGFYATFPYIAMVFFGNGSAWIADGMIRRGTSITFVRKLWQTVAFVGAAICLFLLVHAASPSNRPSKSRAVKSAVGASMILRPPSRTTMRSECSSARGMSCMTSTSVSCR